MNLKMFLTLAAIYLMTANSWINQQENSPNDQCRTGVELYSAGNISDAYPLLESGFQNRDQSTFESPTDLGFCALMLGVIRMNVGDSSGALEAFFVSLEIFQQSSYLEWEGVSLRNIASVYSNQSRYEEALIPLERALLIDKLISDRASEGSTLNSIGTMYLYLGNYEDALETLEDALAIRQELNDQIGRSVTLTNIGAVYRGQGEYKLALANYETALDISRDLDDLSNVGSILNNIASVYESQGRYELAVTTFKDALIIINNVG